MTARVLITHVPGVALQRWRETRYEIAAVQAEDVSHRAHFYTFDSVIADACKDALAHNRPLEIDYRDLKYGNLIERIRVSP